MQVKIDEMVFTINFSYEKISPDHGKKHKNLVSTTCHICVLDTDIGKKEIGCGEARQNYKDKHNGVLGRKIAFTRALTNFNKKDRQAFWEKYKQTCRYVV